MRASSAKAKGRRACAALRDLLLSRFPELSPDDIKVVPSGVVGEDLWLSPAARSALPFCFESKNQEKLNIWDALRQAAGHGSYPGVLSFTRNRGKLYAAVEIETFLTLLRARYLLQVAENSAAKEWPNDKAGI